MSINNSAIKSSNPRLEISLFNSLNDTHTHTHLKAVVINYAYVGIMICIKVIQDTVHYVGFLFGMNFNGTDTICLFDSW